MKSQSVQNKIVKISQTRSIVIATEINLAFRYVSNHRYQFDASMRCFNVVTEKEMPLRKQGGSYGYNIARKFISLTKIKENVERIPNKPTLKITKEKIMKVICDHFNVTSSALHGRSNMGSLGMARRIWAMLLDKYIDNNNTVIAYIMGRKSAASTFDYLQDGEAEFKHNKAFENNYNLVESILKG